MCMLCLRVNSYLNTSSKIHSKLQIYTYTATQKRPVYAGYGHYGPIKFNQQSIDNTDRLLTNQETKSLVHVPCVSLNDKISDPGTNLASTHIDCLNQSQY